MGSRLLVRVLDCNGSCRGRPGVVVVVNPSVAAAISKWPATDHRKYQVNERTEAR